ncbi:mind kinetochore complex component [Colletotrichum sp. SAR 10_65]|nr:mind kinetochore complex component [Colletotrichum sp. SAR 10_65]
MRETDPHPHARRDGDSQEALRLGQHLKQHFWTNGLLTQRIDVLVEEHDVVPGCNRTLSELKNIKGCANDKAAFQLLQKKRDLMEIDAKTPILTTSLFIPTLLMLPMNLTKQMSEKVAILEGYDHFTIGLLSSITGEYYIMISTICTKIASYDPAYNIDILVRAA